MLGKEIPGWSQIDLNVAFANPKSWRIHHGLLGSSLHPPQAKAV